MLKGHIELTDLCRVVGDDYLWLGFFKQVLMLALISAALQYPGGTFVLISSFLWVKICTQIMNICPHKHKMQLKFIKSKVYSFNSLIVIFFRKLNVSFIWPDSIKLNILRCTYVTECFHAIRLLNVNTLGMNIFCVNVSLFVGTPLDPDTHASKCSCAYM